ncbi:MAG TPA: hypothetical protein VF847_08160 [Candidatus Deferrimicrobiaceae bacterium]
MKRPWVVLLAVVLCAGLVAGCATANAIERTQNTFAQAKAAGAQTKAPFEYYAAEAYLAKAVHQADKGDTKQADIFNKQAADYAAKALEMAKGGAK